jgi:hypothetical protein
MRRVGKKYYTHQQHASHSAKNTASHRHPTPACQQHPSSRAKCSTGNNDRHDDIQQEGRYRDIASRIQSILVVVEDFIGLTNYHIEGLGSARSICLEKYFYSLIQDLTLSV